MKPTDIPAHLKQLERHVYWQYPNMRRRQLLKGALGLSERLKAEAAHRSHFVSRRNAGPLTPQQVKAMFAEQSVQIDRAEARSAFQLTDENLQDTDISKQAQTQCAKLFLDFARDRPGLNKVVNVGARTDVVSAYLAQKFPEREFVSVDMHPDLAGQNRFLPQSSNWSYFQGYAIDLMRDGRLSGDVVIMTSVAVLMNNAEFDEFLKLAHQRFSAVLINEVFYGPDDYLRLMRYRITKRPYRPEDVPIDRPWCAGPHSNYMHNYPKKLERRGFSVNISRFSQCYQSGFLYQVAAEK